MAMRFEHEFSVPVPVEQAWAVLLDVERVAPCLPGAALDIVEGDEFTGRMKVKVGPITVTYRGSARFEEIDKDSYSIRLKAGGKEARGSGTAEATVNARLAPDGDRTAVKVETMFNVTGRPAQFGRGVMQEVGSKLIDRFAANLADLLAGNQENDVEALAAEPQPTATADEGERHLTAVPGTLRTSRTPDEEALDLLEIAGAPLIKRVAPVVGALAVVALLIWVIRRLFR
ncbi:SRPBCC family protein [Nonomuraea soli]|uniref:Carbon monoxide dehydrogenase subunit G n=1 Tax=Nonomuraea soli TaxID=1032476 RepID=A0A7W0HVI7_9ACTN|nr:SRPBCC family protein [Nonomuraea soli]MBA2897294.1 carbon monoxide dehydrogenase subunit G [Nonomuraea soli]